MSLRAATSPNGVYRTPGRAPDEAPARLPSWRALLAPLGLAAGAVAIVVVAIAAWNALFPTPSDAEGLRFVPAVDRVQDGLAIGLVATLALLVFLIVRRVRPSWRGVRLRHKVLYVATMLVVQSVVVAGGELAIFESRGGLRLFEPTWQGSIPAPNGGTAHLYKESFGCGYEVYESEPLHLTMRRTLYVPRLRCDDPTPAMKVNEDGSVGLVGRDDAPLQPEAAPPMSFGLGGC